MATSLSYSTFENNENDDSKQRNKRKNRTIKKKTKKVENFLNGLASMDEGEDDSGLANFTANLKEFPPNPKLTKQPEKTKENISSTDDAVSPEAFSQMPSNEAANLNYQNYFKTYVPYYSNASNDSNLHGSRDELMRKLNYMIHLLEENKDEKTSNVTEELVLYMFLGVFVIFVVDSFARAGKYTR